MRKRLAVLLLLSIALGLTSCKRHFTADEYDVVSAGITGLLASQQGEAHPTNIVISKMTSSGDDDVLPDESGRPVPWEKRANFLRQQAPSLQETTIDSFRKANAHQVNLDRAFRFSVGYEIVDQAQVDLLFNANRDPWGSYYKQYPGSQGIATLSRVGFNTERTQALFYISNRCGGLCGGGFYVVMKKWNGVWLIEKEIDTWVS